MSQSSRRNRSKRRSHPYRPVRSSRPANITEGRRGQKRKWEDAEDFEEMKKHPLVIEFLKRDEFRKSVLNAFQLREFLSSAKSLEENNHRIRHQILIRLIRSSFLDMKGPIAGTIIDYIGTHDEPSESTIEMAREAFSMLLDIVTEILNRIPHCRNTESYVRAIINLLKPLVCTDSPRGFSDKSIHDRIKDIEERLLDPKEMHSMLIQSSTWSTNSSFIKEPIIPSDLTQLLEEKLDPCYINPIKGAYTSTAHYLETLYRMMREDFMAPLRKAVTNFQKTFKPGDRLPSRVYLDDCYHYTFIRLVAMERNEGKILLEYSSKGLEHVDWQITDRLRFGSMIVLSDDHFQTAVYATIVRPPSREKAAERNQVWLQIENIINISKCQGLEPMALYEPTRCTLERLKIVAAKVENGKPFPMDRYIVRVERNILPPVYMRQQSKLLLKREGTQKVKTDTIDPKLDVLDLDPSQKEALKLALTNELALIQGPPGTGKSYVGATLVNILMMNRELWQTYDHGCILLLAYKNHAIDQFIRECERMGMDMTETVRLGGRSNEDMCKYTLFEKCKMLSNYHEYQSLNFDIRQQNSRMKEIQNGIKDLNNVAQERVKTPINLLKLVIPSIFYKQLATWARVKLHAQTIGKKEILEWVRNEEWNHQTFFLHLENTPPLNERTMNIIYYDGNQIDDLPTEFRCRLYKRWQVEARQEARRLLHNNQQTYEEQTKKLRSLRRQQDLAVVHRARIIAATTTGASKYGDLIDAVKPTIVLCEEAAEVLESHIIASLTENCQHLVLIGDHQQLRPEAIDYQMQRRNYNISLFERLVNNDIPSKRLNVQHRMHPDIAKILVPNIYETLENHTNVSTYQMIRGFKKRMQFVYHSHPEEQAGEKTSQTNRYEADFLVNLCHYILQQDYPPEDITILVTYKGQLRLIKEKIVHFRRKNPKPTYTKEELRALIDEEFREFLDAKAKNEARLVGNRATPVSNQWLLSKEKEYNSKIADIAQNKSKIENVRVTTVDNYQGEESPIILLSFVRSNKVGNIGFLKWANRICVALSRAKYGFFAIGDFKLFAKNQKSDLWKKLCAQLLASGELNKKLEIVCSKHGTQCDIDDPELFLTKSPEGGCLERCDCRLDCGHVCTRLCHGYDQQHTKFQCETICNGSLSCGHSCRRLCALDGDCCQLSCSLLHVDCHFQNGLRKCDVCQKMINCKMKISISPSCGHHGETECSWKEYYTCQTEIESKLTCGHSQKHACCEPIQAIICGEPVKETLPCGHEISRACNELTPICMTQVVIKLKCGHETECQCFLRYKPMACRTIVRTILPCGHEKDVQCCEMETEHVCEELVTVTFDCGHKRTEPCNRNVTADICDEEGAVHRCNETELCKEVVPITLTCGHEKMVPCRYSDRPLMCSQDCEIEVESKSPCGHRRLVPCSKASLTAIKGCIHPVQVQRHCGHESTVQCRFREEFLKEPCWKSCLLSCSHGQCEKLCSDACERCLEPCQSQCPHQRCTRLCNEECDRVPCNKRCKEYNDCGHLCEGLCGEFCLYDCNKCCGKHGIVRRVRIKPCNHEISVSKLDEHMKVRENARVREIQAKYCPRPYCARLITECPRYVNVIKSYMRVRKRYDYTPEKTWWYCKQGEHDMCCSADTDLLTTKMLHDCAVYREPIDYAMGIDDNGESLPASPNASTSPSYTKLSSIYSPTAPYYRSTSPRCEPTSPCYEPTSPGYEPTSPCYEPTSPCFESTSPCYEPTSPNCEPPSPCYEPTSPCYEPTSSCFEPTSPYYELTSPPCEPTSPCYEPTSPCYEPTSPRCEPTSSHCEPSSPCYEPTSPRCEPTSSHCEPSSPCYEPTSPCYPVLARLKQIRRKIALKHQKIDLIHMNVQP